MNNKLLKWFFKSSGYAVFYLAIIVFFGLGAFHDASWIMMFSALLFIVMTIGVTMHYLQLKKMGYFKKDKI